ncbi:NB-ARC domain-containing protein [Leptolyngbya boryana CZ1]|uniref:NB-ARC domain-containing protein n=1 Tax=Leptolyngbya boryana CZ1 TaxID=3060204 RepID=A0AA96WT89_LEPBY|nr:NB-ARC domain-containing protein [Leptolyngbya boryana]WNZ45237.1 NB-ARC domain-containing protein [Leptolyngbya boryana CZ1]
MNANTKKLRRNGDSSARVRGVVLSPHGWQRFQAAKQQVESEENWDKRFTQEDLNERTGLSLNTLARILKRELGVDRQSLEILFRSFDLELTKTDYVSPIASGEALSQQRDNPHQDWDNAVDATVFYGRETELVQLCQWIMTERCRVVGLLGIGGIGKSTIAVKAAQQMQAEFEIVVWRSLVNAPLFDDLLTSLLRFLMPVRGDDPLIPTSLDAKLSKVMEYLRSQRCLLILDNVETILQSEQVGQWRSGYESYGQFLRTLGETPHQSCCLLTSREKPCEIALLDGEQSPVRSLTLSGLTPDDGRAIFRQKGTFTGSEAEWQTLINYYGGNPLALKLLAAATQDLFNGNIAGVVGYLDQGTFAFEDICDLLARQFNRLSVEEQKILYWFAIHREPVSIAEIRQSVEGSALQQTLPQHVNSLLRRSLIEKAKPTTTEKTDSLFFLQPVVMEYVTDRFIQQVCTEFTTQQLDIWQSHSLVRAQSKDYIREMQLRLIMQPVLNWLLSSYRNVSNVENRVRRLLAQQQQQSDYETGYTAGNLINLLVQLKVDLRGSNFSGLVVQQADLRQVSLVGVNFQNADLTTSIFSETFGNPVSIDISPDQQMIAVGDCNGLIYLWNVETMQLLATFAGHTGWVWSVAFSPDGTTLASSSGDTTIRVWEVKSSQCLQVLTGHTGCVWSVRFSPDGQRLASGSDDQTVRIWNEKGHCLHILEGHEGNVYSVHFSPNNQTLVSGSKDTSIRIWNVSNGDCLGILQGHTDSVRCVRYSPDGQMLASSSHDYAIRLWKGLPGLSKTNAQPLGVKVLHGHANWVWSLAFSPNGDILASGSDDGSLRLWAVQEERCIHVLNGQSTDIFAIALVGQLLVSVSRDQAVRLWNLHGHHLKTLRGYNSGIRSLSLSPVRVTTPAGETQMLASTSQDEAIHLWQIPLDNPRSSLHPTQSFYKATSWLASLSFHPNGQTFATNEPDSPSIALWNMQTGRYHHWNSGHAELVKTVLFSPGGNILASGSFDRTVRLWDAQTHQCLQVLRGHESGIWSIAFNVEGTQLASGSFDHTVRVWDLHGKCLQVLRGHTGGIYALVFHPDGERLVSGSFDHTIRVWNLYSGECLQILHEHTGGVWSLAISPDGQTLASGGDRTIRLWDLKKGNCVQVLHGHTRWISALIFMPPNSSVSQLGMSVSSSIEQILVSGSHDETIKLWNTQTGECLSTLMADRLYEGMTIQDATGLTNAQKETLKALGAISQ